MTNQESFFQQLKSAFVPLLKKVVDLIPKKVSELENDSEYITMPDVTRAAKSSGAVALNTTPTFLVSEENTRPGGGSVAASIGQPNAGTTTYTLKRYTAQALKNALGISGDGDGTELTALDNTDWVDPVTDYFPIIRHDFETGQSNSYKISLQTLLDAFGGEGIFDDPVILDVSVDFSSAFNAGELVVTGVDGLDIEQIVQFASGGRLDKIYARTNIIGMIKQPTKNIPWIIISFFIHLSALLSA